jgi:hypothetical protein
MATPRRFHRRVVNSLPTMTRYYAASTAVQGWREQAGGRTIVARRKQTRQRLERHRKRLQRARPLAALRQRLKAPGQHRDGALSRERDLLRPGSWRPPPSSSGWFCGKLGVGLARCVANCLPFVVFAGSSCSTRRRVRCWRIVWGHPEYDSGEHRGAAIDRMLAKRGTLRGHADAQ